MTNNIMLNAPSGAFFIYLKGVLMMVKKLLNWLVTGTAYMNSNPRNRSERREYQRAMKKRKR